MRSVTHFLRYSSLKCSKQTFTVRSAIVNSFLSCGRFRSLLMAFRNSKTRRHSEIKQTRPSTKQDFSGEALWSLTSLTFMQLVPGDDRVVRHICIRCIKRVVFSDCSRLNRFETHAKSLHGRSNNQNTLPPLSPNRYFHHLISRWSVTKPLSQWTIEAEEREPGNEVVKSGVFASQGQAERRLNSTSFSCWTSFPSQRAPKIWKKRENKKLSWDLTRT